MKTQKNPIGDNFRANILQLNLQELFQYAHDHLLRNTFPTAKEGVPRDIVLVDDGTSVYVCIKTSRGWFKSAAFTAV
jgi:hypothetical protein